MYLTVKLLLPGVIKSVYNLNDKQIVKLFSRIFNCNPDDMARDLEQVRGKGEVGSIPGGVLPSRAPAPFFLVGAHTVLETETHLNKLPSWELNVRRQPSVSRGSEDCSRTPAEPQEA